MHGWIDIETPHGPVRGWRAEPTGPSKGAVLVIQEIFGVNAHVRSVAERLAGAGFVAVAPALFDPVEHGVELDYTDAGMQRAAKIPSSPLSPMTASPCPARGSRRRTTLAPGTGRPLSRDTIASSIVSPSSTRMSSTVSSSKETRIVSTR